MLSSPPATTDATPAAGIGRAWRFVALVLGAWLMAALVYVAAGGLAAPVFPPAFIGPLTAAVLAAVWFVRPVRRWAALVDMRVLLAVHLVRFVGAYFLALAAAGRMVREFAIPAGVGDLVVAGALVALLFWRSPADRTWRRAALAWNVVGLIDIVLVIANGLRLAAADRAALDPFRTLPLGLLPTFFLPLILATHVILIVRLSKQSQGNLGQP